MFSVEKSVHIEKPAADVFSFVSEFANDAKWQDGIVRSEQTSQGPIGVGTTGQTVQKFMGRELKNDLQVTTFEPPKRFGAKTTSGPVQFEVMCTLEEMGGGTHMTVHMEGEPGGFFKVAEGMVKNELNKTIDRDLAKLKQVLEI
jgi:carbon monoxide dehydrogenase subunit G